MCFTVQGDAATVAGKLRTDGHLPRVTFHFATEQRTPIFHLISTSSIMKTARPVLLTLVALAGVVTADGIPTAANATDMNTSGITSATHNKTIELGPGIRCTPRSKDGVWSWYYNSKSDGPYSCTTKGGGVEWSMLSAYRSGGTEGVHWKYTENPNDSECLKDWKIYSSDGETVTATVSGRTTTQGGWRWCALPVYRSGGVYNKQWGDCWCQWE